MTAPRLATLIQRLEGRHPGARLGAITALRGELDELEAAYVADAVAAGLSWAQIGAALGVSKQAAHARHSRHPAVASARRAEHDGAARVAIADETRAAIDLARREAARSGDAAVDTDHLLIAIVRSDETRIGSALRTHGLSLERLRRAASDRAGAMHARRNGGSHDANGRRPISPDVRRVLQRAVRRASSSGTRLDVDAVLDELLREPRGGAARVLERLRVSRVELRAALSAA